MAEQGRIYLRNEFRDGERPTGADFTDLIDSFINKTDDLVTVDTNGNLDIPAGINLKDTTTGVNGSLRFNSGQVQVFNGASWTTVGGASGAFTQVGGGPHVAFGGGNVGIGPFAIPPTFRLEIDLGNNSGPDQRVRFGNAVLANGQGALQTSAQFAHQSHADNNTNFALRQGPAGDVNLNAPNGQAIMISHNRTTARVFVAANGVVVIGSNAPAVTAPASIFQVFGGAAKNDANANWTLFSDARLKQDIQPFQDGLAKLMSVKPVKFRYDGRLRTDPNKEEVGILGQEIEQVFPYMITRATVDAGNEEDLPEDLRMYNGSALTYVMVNAIQELAARVVDLETKLNSKKKA